MARVQSIKLGDTEYVIIPRAEYLRLRTKSGTAAHELADAVDAVHYARNSIGADLKKARSHAKLTQIQLARKLRKSQALVSGAERGTVSVSERYVAAVLKACKLPANWNGRC